MTRFEEAKQLRQQGLTIGEIAIQMGITHATARFYVYSDPKKHKIYDKGGKNKKRIVNIKSKISKQIEKYSLPQTWEKECYVLYEEFLKSHSSHIGRPTRLIDSILLLLCRKKRFIEPKELIKATRGPRGYGAGKSLHFFRILEVLDGITPTSPMDYIRKFFVGNSQYERFLSKALDIASKLPRKFKARSPRVLASACIYVSSISTLYADEHRPLITQRELSKFFKVTDVSIRNVYPKIIHKLKDMNTILTEEEIEWSLAWGERTIKSGRHKSKKRYNSP